MKAQEAAVDTSLISLSEGLNDYDEIVNVYRK